MTASFPFRSAFFGGSARRGLSAVVSRLVAVGAGGRHFTPRFRRGRCRADRGPSRQRCAGRFREFSAVLHRSADRGRGVEGCVSFVDVVTVMPGCGAGLYDILADAKRLARALECSGPTTVGKDPGVSDSLESFGKDMEREASDKVVRGECRGAVSRLAMPWPGRLSGSEGDVFSIESQDAPVADGDSVGVWEPNCYGNLESQGSVMIRLFR